MRRWSIPWVLCLTLWSEPAGAAENLRFEAYWGGLHAADFALSLDEDGGSHWFHLETRGLLDWLLELRVEATSTPRTAYRVHYTNRRRDRTVEVRYDNKTGEAHALATTRAEDPEAPDETEYSGLDPAMRTGVTDPLAGFVEALARLRTALEGGAKSFTLAVFDGRRRFDMDGLFLGTAVRTIGETRYPAYRLRLTTRPLAGFKKAHKLLWDGSAFDLYVTRDGRFLPLQIDSVGPGPIIHMVAECPERCRLPEDD